MKINEEEYDNEKNRLGKEYKKSLQTIVELQQVIDDLRSRSNVQPMKKSDGPSASDLEE